MSAGPRERRCLSTPLPWRPCIFVAPTLLVLLTVVRHVGMPIGPRCAADQEIASVDALPTSAAESANFVLYDADPEHPWNQLHRLLFIRGMQDGKLYDREDLEPPLLPTSKFLTEGASYKDALAILDEFVKDGAARRIKDPLKRGILQHDLWGVFAILAGGARDTFREGPYGRVELDGIEDPGDRGLERKAERRALQTRLVQIMQQVALAPEEIEALPDNLADAVKAGAFPKTFDADHPERPFLPPDLLNPNGTWVPVSSPYRNDGLAAPAHLRFTKGRSLFLVFIRTPAGRQATQAALKTMEFPSGTEAALLRRMYLIDNTGTLRLTHLTESLQLRVFRQPNRSHPAFELTLERGELFGRRKGGLRPIGDDEILFFNFGSLGGHNAYRPDPFEEKHRPQSLPVKKSCMQCHVDINGNIRLNSAFSAGTEQPKFAPDEIRNQVGKEAIVGWTPKAGLVPTEMEEQDKQAANWTLKTYTWGLLQGMWRTQRLE